MNDGRFCEICLEHIHHPGCSCFSTCRIYVHLTRRIDGSFIVRIERYPSHYTCSLSHVLSFIPYVWYLRYHADSELTLQIRYFAGSSFLSSPLLDLACSMDNRWELGNTRGLCLRIDLRFLYDGEGVLNVYMYGRRQDVSPVRWRGRTTPSETSQYMQAFPS